MQLSNTRVTRVSQTRALVPPRSPRNNLYSCASRQRYAAGSVHRGERSRPAGHMTCSARVDVVHRVHIVKHYLVKYVLYGP